VTDELARAEADVERARERLSASVIALRAQVARQGDWRRGSQEGTMKTKEEIEAAISEAGERAKPQLEDARRHLSSLSGKVTDYIKENPGRSLLGALAIGFVIGKIARRS
jgi:ElaB/YqjD/DUF883 family membrane-anchored ribosome-binding protein